LRCSGRRGLCGIRLGRLRGFGPGALLLQALLFLLLLLRQFALALLEVVVRLGHRCLLLLGIRSPLNKKPRASRPGVDAVARGGTAYAGCTSSACMPFWPCTATNVTRWPSARLLKPEPWMERKCTNRSGPLSGVMKPKPFASLNHLT